MAILGVYGVLAYVFAQRTREIGIRLALGAPPRELFRTLVAQGMSRAAAGIAAGLGGSLVLGRFLRGLLFGIAADDLPTFAAVALFLAVAALIAAAVAARKVWTVDPVSALRSE
jgi:ABC-type antimicrobial peptide transport system permease subunit